MWTFGDTPEADLNPNTCHWDMEFCYVLLEGLAMAATSKRDPTFHKLPGGQRGDSLRRTHPFMF